MSLPTLPFLREVEILVGPLTDWQGGGDERLALRFFGDGTPDRYRIAFSIQKHMIAPGANPTSVRFWNLAPETRAALAQPGAQLRVLAGWRQTGRLEVFKGALLAAVSLREGADVVTTLSALPYYGGAALAVTTNSYQLGERLARAVLDLARKLPGVHVDERNVRLGDTAFGSQGWAFAGGAADGLDRLAREHRFSWRVVDGAFYAERDGEVTARVVEVDSESGLLLRAEPTLGISFNNEGGGPARLAPNGMSITSVFHPWIEPGCQVDLRSAVNPRLNASYQAHVVTHSGDTHGQDWTTRTETLYYRGFPIAQV